MLLVWFQPPLPLIMSHHLSTQDIQRYRQRQMSPQELRAVHDHIATCETCRAPLRDAKRSQVVRAALWADLQTARVAAEHLSYEQREAYVDETLDTIDRSTVESHLAFCPQCAAEIRDLRAFRAMLTTHPAQGQDAPVTRPVWEKFLAWWRVPTHWIPLQLAGTAAVVVLCVWLAMRPLQMQLARMETRLSHLQQTNDTLQTQLTKLQMENKGIQEKYRTAESTIADLQIKLAQLQQPQNSKPKTQNLVVLNDGGKRVTLDKQGNLSGLSSLPPAYQQRVKAVLATGKVKTPSALLAQLVVKSGGPLMGPDEGLSPVSPVGTVVLTDKPTFSWKPLEKAARYTVSVFDEKEDAVDEQTVSETRWTPTKPLPRGKALLWQVIVLDEDGKVIETPSAQARFKILEESEVAQLNRVRNISANSPLTLGVLYAERGLLDDAEREFQKLLRDNPNSAIAQKLLNDVRALRHYRSQK